MGVLPRKQYSLQMKSGRLALGDHTLVMGIINITPDSFSDGGKFFNFDSAVRQAQDMIANEADILDIGGESTRPYSDPVSIDEELRRVLPVIKEVRSFSQVPISIDTTKAEVARQALLAGADIINDVSSFRSDPDMVDLAAQTGVPIVLMHMQGTPKNMQEAPCYASLFSEIIGFLEERIQFAMQHGVSREQIVVDPGIGFGKNVAHNSALIRNIEIFNCLDRPILLGACRKRFIGTILNRPVEDREIGTAVANSFAIAAGVHIIRVHDVAIHRQVALMGDALRLASPW